MKVVKGITLIVLLILAVNGALSLVYDLTPNYVSETHYIEQGDDIMEVIKRVGRPTYVESGDDISIYTYTNLWGTVKIICDFCGAITDVRVER